MATEVTLNQHALSDVACVEIVTEDEKVIHLKLLQK